MNFTKSGLLSFVLLCSANILQAQDVKVWSFHDLENYLNEPSDKLKVVNFWATWCAPCIKELPYFQELADKKSDKVDVMLVSLDFADLLDSKVKPMISRKGILSPQLILLNDENYNEWIDKIDPSWSGALPGTLFIDSTGEKRFHEGELAKEELYKKVKELETL